MLASLWAVVLSAALPAVAQPDDRSVEVVEVAGIIDDRLAGFVQTAIEAAGGSGTVEVVVLQLDSPGVVASPGVFAGLMDMVADPPLPLAVWVGPEPAVAFGGAAQLLAAAPLRAVAPGSSIGYAAPTFAGTEELSTVVPVPDPLASEAVEVEAPIVGIVDLVQPSLRQLIILDIDGRSFSVEAKEVRPSTVVPFGGEDGEEGVTNLPTVIRQPGAWDQLLRLATRPEVAFFLLVAGLTLAAFEFYAIGPGIAAGVAAVALALSAYGLAVLPVRWWAVTTAVASVLVLSWSFQRGGVLVLNALGIVGLVASGFGVVDAAPQFHPAAPGVLLTVAAGAFFFLLAMPTVGRSRFSTQTIGREDLIGRAGTAVSDLGPEGEVEVDGARWRAMSHREAGIRAGDRVAVVAVDGWFLEVEPVPPDS